MLIKIKLNKNLFILNNLKLAILVKIATITFHQSYAWLAIKIAHCAQAGARWASAILPIFTSR